MKKKLKIESNIEKVLKEIAKNKSFNWYIDEDSNGVITASYEDDDNDDLQGIDLFDGLFYQRFGRIAKTYEEIVNKLGESDTLALEIASASTILTHCELESKFMRNVADLTIRILKVDYID